MKEETPLLIAFDGKNQVSKNDKTALANVRAPGATTAAKPNPGPPPSIWTPLPAQRAPAKPGK